ncbi:MAG: sulfotransferase family protein, partial [Mycobacterium sp.]
MFVLGVGRSGSSALTRVLSLCGGTLPAGMRRADWNNPRGYWEPRATLSLNEAILRRQGSAGFDFSLRLLEEGAFDADEKAACIAKMGAFLNRLPVAPLVVIKDSYITNLSGMWFEAARVTGLDVTAVITVRHPHEVIASQAAAGPMSPELTSAVWLKYALLAERHTRGLPRVFVSYANLLHDWRRELTRISKTLAIDLHPRDKPAIEEFLTPELRHQRHSGPVTERFGADWLPAVYEAMHAAARDEPWDESVLDRVFEEYRVAEDDFRTAFENYHALVSMGVDRV